jgi:hypothetical protein
VTKSSLESGDREKTILKRAEGLVFGKQDECVIAYKKLAGSKVQRVCATLTAREQFFAKWSF